MPEYGPQEPLSRLSWPPPIVIGSDYYTEEELQQLFEELKRPMYLNKYLFFNEPARTIYEKLYLNWKEFNNLDGGVDPEYMIVFWILYCVKEEDLLLYTNTMYPTIDVVKWRYRVGK